MVIVVDFVCAIQGKHPFSSAAQVETQFRESPRERRFTNVPIPVTRGQAVAGFLEKEFPVFI